jgi:NTP pyrophosphatase (non-canonical NTP hydrolase)
MFLDWRYNMSITQLKNEIYESAKEKGWWDIEQSFSDKMILFHNEISEAVEEYRNGHPVTEIYIKDGKPEGVPIELADCIIRILDFCAHYNLPIEDALRIKVDYNKTRPYRHGGKKI